MLSFRPDHAGNGTGDYSHNRSFLPSRPRTAEHSTMWSTGLRIHLNGRGHLHHVQHPVSYLTCELFDRVQNLLYVFRRDGCTKSPLNERVQLRGSKAGVIWRERKTQGVVRVIVSAQPLIAVGFHGCSPFAQVVSAGTTFNRSLGTNTGWLTPSIFITAKTSFCVPLSEKLMTSPL